MTDNILFVLDVEFHLLEVWASNSMERVCKLLKLFWKLPLVLEKNGRVKIVHTKIAVRNNILEIPPQTVIM